ncbi:MAG: histidine kinase dimerization/phospho-acceptor domain-containing protein, partial [Jiangellaceae bacterium]
MDVVAAGALAAFAGAAVGLAAGLAFRVSERGRDGPTTDQPAGVPEGVDEVLSVLRASAIVLDESYAVVKASPAAYAFGLIRQDRVAVPELLTLARRVRRDGQIREVQLEIARSRDTTQNLYVAARMAPMGRLLLTLIEDRTQSIRVDEVRRDFVANVSHELKTPVGALMLLAEAVEHASDDPEAVRRFAVRMQREGGRLTRLVQEI